MCGYQGWFRADGDGSGRGWVHYGRGGCGSNTATVDLWPDVSEYKTTYRTGFKLEDGSPARVFSSWDESAVDLHFRWMQEYGIDGVFVQRFAVGLADAESLDRNNTVLANCREGADTCGRTYAIM